jgi:alpha,alpha-trehalase
MATARREEIDQIREYIREHWEMSIRAHRDDSGDLIGLPYPYVVPCMKGMFQEIYYWDTYFANLGLIAQGMIEQARNNVDDLLYLVERFGFVPNGSRTYYLKNSQIPYLAMMVSDIFELTRDEAWLSDAYQLLKTEYDFWMQKRATVTGLNRYYHNAGPAELLNAFQDMQKRLGRTDEPGEAEQLARGAHVIAEYESGMDFNPRFESRGCDFNPVDLNCNLYRYEQNLAHFSAILGNGETAAWERRAERRRELINRFCWNEANGLFMDYDFVNGRPAAVRSVVTLYPLWVGLATPEQARSVLDRLKVFEADFGLLSCEKRDNAPVVFQWDYPNGFPPMQYIAIKGLLNYGWRDHAERIAAKYVDLIVKTFGRTGDLWEKYNVVNGTTEVIDEYKMPAMLGWTAGVFLYAADLLTGE